MNTRSKTYELNIYYLEIERTLHLLKKTKSQSEHAPERESELHHNHTFGCVSLDSSVNRSSHNHFNSRLKLMAGNLQSKWDGPFEITNVL